ncbi:MAG: SIMPL domain-containing protein [Verrucomicrobia bacterium]|nr:SIMPL domain-containing protein [Verrucomicrobiota bacterium]
MNGSGKAAAAILGLALVVATVVISRPLQELVRNRATVTVKGFAEKPIEADMAIVSTDLNYQGKTVGEALRRLEVAEEQVRKIFEASGGEVSCNPVMISKRYKLDAHGNLSSEIEGYDASRDFSVYFRQTEKAATLITNLEKLMTEQVGGLSLRRIEYLCNELGGMKANLLEEAMKDARVRADKMAATGGRKIGGLVSAQQGVFQLTDPNSTEISATGILDTDSRIKSLKATVTAQYWLR